MELELRETLDVCGMAIPCIAGGFGKNKKAMLAKHVADIHGKTLKGVNRAINMNRHRFRDQVDLIDLKREHFLVHLMHQGVLSKNAVNRSSNIYLLSERGYAKLMKIFDDEKSWEYYDRLLDEYFDRQEESDEAGASPAELILNLAHQLVHHENKVKKMDQQYADTANKVTSISNHLTKKPTRSQIVHKVQEYARVRGTRNINTCWNEVYHLLKAKYGIDILTRVKNRKDYIQGKRLQETGKVYAPSTLEKKVNGLDIIFEEAFEQETMDIVAGLISQKY
ncbi:ORF6N domain-containing protein [Salibacterium aidingense]|uniref:ORF6N domain-containing protein n=1 Tax=Salibacterium aidingense TaxID=384933 RepID=UPI00040517EC|nr:ORF6N domain-containing protein [Salibacterium aidingense]